MVCIYVSMPQLSVLFFAHFLINYHVDCVRLTLKLQKILPAPQTSQKVLSEMM